MAEEVKTQKRKRSGKTIWTIVLILVVAVGIYAFTQYRQYQQGLQTLAQLETVPYSRETFVSSVNGTGTVRPEHQAVLIWQTSGTVDQSDLTVGDAVRKDQVILKLDENDLPVDIIQARADKFYRKSLESGQKQEAFSDSKNDKGIDNRAGWKRKVSGEICASRDWPEHDRQKPLGNWHCRRSTRDKCNAGDGWADRIYNHCPFQL